MVISALWTANALLIHVWTDSAQLVGILNKMICAVEIYVQKTQSVLRKLA